MPIIQAEFLPRSTEQKREFVKAVTEATVKTLGCSAEAVSIIIREMPTDCYAVAGVLQADQK